MFSVTLDEESKDLLGREGRSYMYSPPQVDRIWGIWGSYFNIPKAMFYLLKGDYMRMRRYDL